MLQETESQASNTTEWDIQESGEEETNESNRDHERPRGRPESNGTINANKEWSDEEILSVNQCLVLNRPTLQCKTSEISFERRTY